MYKNIIVGLIILQFTIACAYRGNMSFANQNSDDFEKYYIIEISLMEGNNIIMKTEYNIAKRMK